MDRYFISQILTILDLSCNRIGDVGVQCVADALQQNTVTLELFSFLSISYSYFLTQTLTELMLGNQDEGNSIGDNEIQYLANALRQNQVKYFF